MELREGEASVWLLLGEGIGSQDAAFSAFVQGWVIIKVGLVFRVLEGFLVTWNLGDQTYGGRGGTGIPASVCAGSAILITPSSHVSMGLAGLWHCVWGRPRSLSLPWRSPAWPHRGFLCPLLLPSHPFCPGPLASPGGLIMERPVSLGPWGIPVCVTEGWVGQG